MKNPIRVLIADNDPLICSALVRLLQPADDIDVIATAADAETALDFAVRLRPDVALVDVGNAQMDGLAITLILSQQAPETRVVMLSIYATFRGQAFEAGARWFLLKDCSRDELLAAVRLTALGQRQANENGRA